MRPLFVAAIATAFLPTFVRADELPRISDKVRAACEKRLERISWCAPNYWGMYDSVREPAKASGVMPMVFGSAAYPPPGTPDLGVPFGFKVALPPFGSSKFESEMVAGMKSLRYLVLENYRYDLDDFRKLADHPSLSMLYILNGDDMLLEVLKGFKNLEYLLLGSGDQVTGAGVKHLARSAKLKWLYLLDAKLKDGDYATVAAMTALTHLNLSGGTLTDTALSALARSPGLEVLGLAGTRGLTEQGIAAIKGMKKLRALDLPAKWCGDRTLRELKGLPHIKGLGVKQPTAEALDVLCGMTHLEYLDLRHQGMKPADIDRLKKALPKCAIDH